ITLESRRYRGLPGIPHLPNLASTIEPHPNRLLSRCVHPSRGPSTLLKENSLFYYPPQHIRPVNTHPFHLLAETVRDPKRNDRQIRLPKCLHQSSTLKASETVKHYAKIDKLNPGMVLITRVERPTLQVYPWVNHLPIWLYGPSRPRCERLNRGRNVSIVG